MTSHRVLAAAAALAIAAGSLAACGGAPADSRPDVVLVTIDSLRADAPGFMGGKVETPAMDALAAKGITFTTAISPAPQTLPAIAAILTGMYPEGTTVHDDGIDRLPQAIPTLATLFKKAGYATGAFPSAMALHPKHGLARDFDVYQDAFSEVARLRTSPAIGIPAAKIVDRAIEWLGALPPGKRSFLWVHLFDPHFFYEPPSPYKEKYADNPYGGEVASADHELGRLMKWLEDHGRDATSIIVLAGNHGEALGESGEEYHGILLRETTLRVPMVLRASFANGGRGAVGKSADPVSLVDIAPTIADLAGLDRAGMQGTSLAGYAGKGERPAASRALYFETMLPRTLFGWAPLRGVREGGLKYVEAPGTGHTELYDLAADPNEERDLAPARTADASRLAAETVRLGGAVPAPRALTGAQVEVVKELGLPTSLAPGAPKLPWENVGAGNAALKGHRSLQRGLMQAAAFLLSDALKRDPANELALLDSGTMLMMMRRFPQADDSFKRAQAAAPADGETYHELGHTALVAARSAADAEKARKLFELAVRLDPLNEEGLYDAACAVASTNPDVAIDYLDRAVKNGFRDFQHMSRDTDLDPIRKNPRFAQVTEGKAVAAAGPGGPAGRTGPRSPSESTPAPR
ncbi:MAG: sulfatase-like hydrolase/transferase [Acidobacteria bacterium]|nr:sulfatase-like hydrolase/transferase [Acidobacteriota bacterium]